MKNTLVRRITAGILAVSVTLSMSLLTGCNEQSELPEKDWSISDADKENVRELMAEAVYSGGKVSITLTSDTACFTDSIAANDIYLTEYKAVNNDNSDTSPVSDISESSEALSDTSDKNSSGNGNNNDSGNERIKKLEVQRKSDTEITVTADTTAETAAYYIAVHKDAVTDGKFAEAVTASSDSSRTVDIELDKSYAVSASDTDPVLDIDRDELGGISDISSSICTTGGVFADMTVKSAEIKDDKLEITLSGKPVSDGNGIIYLSDESGNYTINISLPVLSSLAVADNASYRLENGKLCFDMSLADDEYSEFTDIKESDVTLDSKNAASVVVSADKKTATVAFDTDADDVDSALNEISGKTVNISSKAVASGMDSSAFIGALNAYISAYISNADIYDNYIEAILDLYVSEGYIEGELTKDSFEFDGGFSDTQVVSIEKLSDSHYKLNVKIDLGKNKLDGEGYLFGNVKLKDGLLYNSRKTLSDDTSTYVFAVIQNGGFIDSDIEDIVDDVKKVLDVAQLFGIPTGPVSAIVDLFSEYATSADTITSIASKCLGLAGITSNDGDDDISKAFDELNNSINRLSNDIADVEKLIQQSDVRMREAFDKQKYISYREAWKSFTNGPMKDMTNIMDEFKSEYTTYLVTFMKNTGYSDSYTGNVNNGTLNVYLNTDNRGVELPSIGNDKFSLYYSETKLDKFVFAPEHLTAACNEENKGKYDDPIDLILADPSYKTALEKFNKDNNLSLTDTEMRVALETQASAYAMSKIDAKKINTVYNNYMEALNDDDLMLGSVMNIYISMLSCYYNFQSEAKENILNMQDFLTTYTIRATSFASYASWFNSGYDRKSNPIKTQYDSAMKMLDKDYLHDTSYYVYSPSLSNQYSAYIRIYDYYDWSYVVNDKVRVIMHSQGEGKFGGSSSTLVQSDVIQLMQKRYLSIKENGRTEYGTFGEYLVASGAVPEEYKDMINTDKTYFAADFVYKNEASYESGYICTSAYYADSYYCELGKTYDISKPFGYKEKADPKYLSKGNTRFVNAYTLADVNDINEIKEYSEVQYNEHHFWWKRDTDEIYTFTKRYLDDYALFRQGEIPVFADYTSGEFSEHMASLYKHDDHLYKYKFSDGGFIRTDDLYKEQS